MRILDAVNVETLEERIGELREPVSEFEEWAGEESPHDGSVKDSGLGENGVTEWVTARLNLRFAEAALEIVEDDK